MNSRRKDFCRTPFLWKSVISEGMLINRIPPLLKMHHRIPRELPVRWDPSGYTLTEILMVTLILGIVAAFAYPAFSSWIPSYSLRSAAKDLYANLHLAKGGAIKTNRPWAVIFDPSVKPGRYFICSDDRGNGWDGPPEMGGNDRAEVTVRLANYKGDVDFGHGEATKSIVGGAFPADNMTYTNSPNAAVFNADGTTPILGYVYLSNRNRESFGMGTPANAGVVVLKRWTDGEWKE
jgi:prepilin-type N-terminal cleavage/methylation domain-containing protein